MGVEVRPLGVKCNISCLYCYQNPIRDAANIPKRYDLAAIKSAIERQGRSFTLFGGEPLLIPLQDLEELWKFGLERFGRNGIQTNGTLISEAHIEIFRRYRVHVGISVDGPGPLNAMRWVGTPERTLEYTGKTTEAIEKLCAANQVPSVITTLSRANATKELLPRLISWIKWLDSLGVRSARLHSMEIDNGEVGNRFALTTEEYLNAFSKLDDLERSGEIQLRFDIFRDMRNLLLGRDRSVTCVWAACDPYTTRAVQGIEGNGQASNCGRTNKDGVEFMKANRPGFERQVALYFTPQAVGGCQGCRFFLMCKGQCPGTALNGDWRNRSSECELWYRLFEVLESRMEAEGLAPISKNVTLRLDLEKNMLAGWQRGANLMMADLMRKEEVGQGQISPGGGLADRSSVGTFDKPHGDSVDHRDAHGDHWDGPVGGVAAAAEPPSTIQKPFGVEPRSEISDVSKRESHSAQELRDDRRYQGPAASDDRAQVSAGIHSDALSDQRATERRNERLEADPAAHGSAQARRGGAIDSNEWPDARHTDEPAHHIDGARHHTGETPSHGDHFDALMQGDRLALSEDQSKGLRRAPTQQLEVPVRADVPRDGDLESRGVGPDQPVAPVLAENGSIEESSASPTATVLESAKPTVQLPSDDGARAFDQNKAMGERTPPPQGAKSQQPRLSAHESSRPANESNSSRLP